MSTVSAMTSPIPAISSGYDRIIPRAEGAKDCTETLEPQRQVLGNPERGVTGDDICRTHLGELPIFDTAQPPLIAANLVQTGHLPTSCKFVAWSVDYCSLEDEEQ